MKMDEEKSKNSSNNNNKEKEWKAKVYEVFQTCQDEIKKTTVMGKKMLSASKTNSCLHESYEELGRMAFEDLAASKLSWDNPKVASMLKKIEQCHQELRLIENEMNKVKFASGPEPIAPKGSDNTTNDNDKS
ncbi:MAG: hypothetical protein HN353_08570 [Bdellovibrionales bacterium]|nr:hypothetical protein [Bdellovibrionales bacterium]MBT3526875.1 hypothetical protein [Bdellovibrionales bacterium]MBT7669698.1 hypothetical protein [Bdellovibrionales bacterium]